MRLRRSGPTCLLLFRLVATFLALGTVALAQNFTQPKVVLTNSWPTQVFAGDFDGDGHQDLLYLQFIPGQSTSQTNYLMSIAFGDGTGLFTKPIAQGSVNGAFSIASFVADVDGDGISDFVFVQGTFFVGSQNFVTVWYGTPQRSIRPASPSGYLPFGAKPPNWTQVVAGAFAIGAKQNLVQLDSANNLGVVLLNNGSGNFSPAYQFALPDGAGQTVLTDVNNDGIPDLIVLGQTTNTIDVFLGTTNNPIFRAPIRFAAPAPIHSFLIKDVNNDGRPDLIAEGPKGRIDVFAGNGDGTFQTTSSGGSGTLDGTTGNGGHLIAYGTRKLDNLPYALASTPAGISTLLGTGTQYLGLQGIANAGPGHTSYATADFNGDGIPDLAVDSPEGIAILFGNPDGSFQTNLAFAAGKPAMSSALGEFTSSGNVDAVVTTSQTQAQVLLGGGNGTFAAVGGASSPVPTTPSTGIAGLWSTIALGDYNGDGLLDIAITADGGSSAANGGVLIPTSGNGLSYALGKGDGTFGATGPLGFSSSGQPAPFFGTSIPVPALAPGVKGAVTNVSYPGALVVRTGEFSTGAAEVVSALVDPNPHALAVAGRLRPGTGLDDLVIQDHGSLQVFLNDGTGKFFGNKLGDLAVDGSLTTPGQLVAPDISSTFPGPSAALGFPAFPGSAVIADLDGDGYGDLIVAYANLSANLQAPVAAAPNYLYIWFGSGGGKFLTSAKHPVNPVRLTPSRNFYQVAVADLHGDGILDLILSDGYILSVQTGKGDGTFGAETHYLAGQGINSISVADVNGDGTPDLVLANGGAVLSNPVANLEVLAANPDVNTGGITVLLNHATVTPTLAGIGGTVTATLEPSTYGSGFFLTAAINPPAGTNPPAPTGSFSFSIDGAAIGSANITSFAAVLSVPAFIYDTLAVGSHTLTAVYSGDGNYAAATFSGTHVVASIPTNINLLLCVDPPGSNFPCGNPITATPLISPITMYFGQSLDGVAIESAVDLTGSIVFYSGSSIFCTLNANLLQGSNACAANSGIFPAGTSTVTAAYTGDSTHAGSTSNGIVVTVLADTTVATLTSSLNPATFGQSVTFTANVQGNYSPGIGPVIFVDGNTVLGTVALDATGQAQFTTSLLAIGTHPIHVAFPGSADFNTASSPILNQVIDPPLPPAQSAVALTSSVNPSAPGQPVTFTASVTVPGAFAIIPAGMVAFLDGATTLSTATLNGAGVAVFTTSALSAGSHNITASYSGQPASGGIGPVLPPHPPRPPTPFVAGFHVSGPGPQFKTAPATTPAAPTAELAEPKPQATTATPAILPGTSPVLIQVVTYPLGAEPEGFDLTVSPVPVTIGVGRTAILLVGVRDASGFNQPVALTCSGLPVETTCTFIQTTIPAGGGSTSLYLATAAPHTCGTTTPYFLGSLRRTGAATALFALLILLPGIRRRRRLPRTLLLLLASFAGLAALSGCGNCTDLGTRPGTYSFTVTGTAQGGTATIQSQVIQLTTTIP